MSVRLEKMGECILRLREERGYSLEELAGLTLSSPDELRMYILTVCRTERFITVLHNPI